jgi:hypothetical protein
MPESTLTTPTVHMNGTGFTDLWDGYTAADDALRTLVKTFGNIEFNARDYYVQGPDAWCKARDERTEINRNLHAMQEYLNTIRMALDSQRPRERK